MSNPPEEGRQEAWKRAIGARSAATEVIGVELMAAFNHGKTDPSEMAELGHSTTTGFEFCIERDGVVHTVTVTRDLDT